MTPQILDWLAQVVERWLQQPGAVLEAGSYNVNGSPRSLFAHAPSYVGTDMRQGPGVDVVIDNHDLLGKFGEAAFDTVLCLECFEHDAAFWVTLENLRTMLKPGGHLIVTTPTICFPEHRYPRDYWRFLPDAYGEIFFRDYAILALQPLNSDAGKDTTLAGIARKHG